MTLFNVVSTISIIYGNTKESFTEVNQEAYD